ASPWCCARVASDAPRLLVSAPPEAYNDHMVSHAWARRVLALGLVAACGGGGKKTPVKPTSDGTAKQPDGPAETEAEREKKRHALAVAIVPEDSKCLPPALKEDNAPRLDFAAIG